MKKITQRILIFVLAVALLLAENPLFATMQVKAATLQTTWQTAVSLSENTTNSAWIRSGGQEYYFKYTPSTSGKYVIYSTGSEDTKVYLYNSSGVQLTSNDDGGEDFNFKLTYNLTAGITYYYGVRYYSDSKTGTISFKFGGVYTVQYNANGGSGAPLSQEKEYGVSLTLRSTTPTKTGDIFLGWATSSWATSVSYQPGATYTGNSNLTLYAVWGSIGTWQTAVSLSENTTNSAGIRSGGQEYYFKYTPSTSGKYVIYSTGSEDTKVYLYNSSGVQLTSDDDSGEDLNFKLTYNLTAGITYYYGVRYYSDSKTGTIPFKFGGVYTVQYNANGGSGASLSQEKEYGVSLTLRSTTPTRTGYTFLGWATSSSATSASYQPGATYTGNSNLTLYAVWSANMYTVSYNANGGSGAPSSQIKMHGQSLILSSTRPTRTGYTFLGWATSSWATSASYQPGATYTGDSNLSLYAVWQSASALTVNTTSNSAPITYGGQMYFFKYTPSMSGKYVIYSTGSADSEVYLYNSTGMQIGYDDQSGEGSNFRLSHDLIAGITYYYGVRHYSSINIGTISFNFKRVYNIEYYANGGINAPSSQEKENGVSLTLSSETPIRTGHNFLGWSTSSSATSASYQPGATYTGDSNLSLYAVWQKSLVSIDLNRQPTKTSYYLGETLDTSGLRLNLIYGDGTSEIISSGFTTSGFNSYCTGEQTVTIYYDGFITSFEVYVYLQPEPTAIPIVTPSPTTTATANSTENANIIVSHQYECKIKADGTLELVKYVGTDTILEIPSTIEGYVLTSIGEDAFEGNPNLQRVALPATVTTIGDSAFNSCKMLSSVTLNESVESIGDYAFYNCEKLEVILIPDSVANIGRFALGYDDSNQIVYGFIIKCGENSIAQSYAISNKIDCALLSLKSTDNPDVMATLKFTQKSAKIKRGKKVTLKVKLTGAKKATFSVDKKGKKVVKLSKKKAKSVVVTGKKKGKAVITAKAAGKTAKCKVTVK